MSIVLGIDIETTGLDFEKDEITEIAWVLKEIGVDKPLQVQSFMVTGKKPIPENIVKLTGITDEMRETEGFELGLTLMNLENHFNRADYIVAHNGEFFDKPFLEEKAKPLNLNYFDKKMWLDTKDLPFKEGNSNRLTYAAADLGFLNPFPHAALFDVLTMLKVMESFDFDKFVERSKVPWVVVFMDSDYSDRHIPKSLGYRWENLDNKVYKKKWIKRIKQDELEQEKAKADLPVYIIG